MDEQRPGIAMRIVVALCLAYLLAPVVLVFPLSFSADNVMTFPPTSWGLRWYSELARNQQMIAAFWNSLILAILVTAFCLAIGIPAAYAIVRLDVRGAAFLTSIFTAPLLLPTIVLGLAILIVFAGAGLIATWPGLIVAHLVITLPYALRVLATALQTLPRDIEEAAASLGASDLRVFLRVTLPLMMPGIVGASALCFLVSFDEVVVSLFLTGPNLSTLPVQMFHHAEDRANPMVACIAVLLIAITLAVVLVVERSVGLARTFAK